MSTIHNAVYDGDSDEEQDPDFVPDDQSDGSDEEMGAPADQIQAGTEPVDKEAENVAKEEARASLWASFQSSVVGASTGSATDEGVKLVKVVRKYRFAGDLVSEVVEVAEDSEDAKEWPRWQPSSRVASERGIDESRREASDLPENTRSGAAKNSPPSPAEPSISKQAITAAKSDPPPSTTPAPIAQRPGPRKPKTTLTPLPQGKPKKLTTLEKSAMDWRAHVSQAGAQEDTATASPGGLADELEQNRRGGGYLEKVAFLERVENRREELFEESRKRRRKK